jgi:hypothetical protein
MKVKELIILLRSYDPEAEVEVYGYDGRGEVTGVVETFYNTSSNKWVGIKNGLESEPSDYQKALKEAQILRKTFNRISTEIKAAYIDLP